MKIFISYAYEDDTYRKELEKHLFPLKEKYCLDIWSKENIKAGENWNTASLSKLKEADIILLLLSPDSLASDYIQDIELQKSIRQRDYHKAAVVPILLRSCSWDLLQEFEHIQILPENQQAVSQWKGTDEAFVHIVKELVELMDGIKKREETRLVEVNTLFGKESVEDEKQVDQTTENSGKQVPKYNNSIAIFALLAFVVLLAIKGGIFDYQVILMDSCIEEIVFDKEEFKSLGTYNSHPIKEVLDQNHNYDIEMEMTYLGWNNGDAIRAKQPDLIIIHFSAFYDGEKRKISDRAFYHFMEKMARCKTQFIIYNRGFVPSADQWQQRLIKDIPKLKGKIHILEIPHGSSFKNIDVKLELEQLVKSLSENQLTLLLLN